jgi:hypothetical protein
MAAADRDGRRPARVLWVVDHTQNTIGNFVGLAELLPHIDRRRFEPLAVVPAAGASSAALAAHAIRVLQRPMVPSGWTLNYLRAWMIRRGAPPSRRKRRRASVLASRQLRRSPLSKPSGSTC